MISTGALIRASSAAVQLGCVAHIWPIWARNASYWSGVGEFFLYSSPARSMKAAKVGFLSMSGLSPAVVELAANENTRSIRSG